MSPKGYRSAYEQQWVGIDVCQKSLDVYIRPSEKLFQVTNDEVGIKRQIKLDIQDNRPLSAICVSRCKLRSSVRKN